MAYDLHFHRHETRRQRQQTVARPVHRRQNHLRIPSCSGRISSFLTNPTHPILDRAARTITPKVRLTSSWRSTPPNTWQESITQNSARHRYPNSPIRVGMVNFERQAGRVEHGDWTWRHPDRRGDTRTRDARETSTRLSAVDDYVPIPGAVRLRADTPVAPLHWNRSPSPHAPEPPHSHHIGGPYGSMGDR